MHVGEKKVMTDLSSIFCEGRETQKGRVGGRHLTRDPHSLSPAACNVQFHSFIYTINAPLLLARGLSFHLSISLHQQPPAAGNKRLKLYMDREREREIVVGMAVEEECTNDRVGSDIWYGVVSPCTAFLAFFSFFLIHLFSFSFFIIFLHLLTRNYNRNI